MTQVATGWAAAVLEVVQLTPVRDRPWSAVWRLESSDGLWWLKESRAQTTYEPRLLGLLAALDGALVPQVVVHPERPWVLVADAGRSARDLAAGMQQGAVADFWCGVLARYGQLQRQVDAPALRAVGVPDLSGPRLVDTYDRLLCESGWTAAIREADDLAAVRACRPALVRAAGTSASARPPSIQHDDLHGGNVFAAALDDPSAARVVDWGDASVDHPFGTLRVCLDSLGDDLGLHRDAAPLRRVRDAYLEGWRSRGESRTALLAELDEVLRVAPLVRAASWARALGSPDADDAGAVSSWLVRLARGLLALR